jgi:GNAT superfamily N-acetyltransferase
MSIKRHSAQAAELYVLGVRAEHHRQGIGRMLLDAVEQWLEAQGVCFLQVKTLSASACSAEYDRTRRFYEAMGFVPLEEFPKLWSERNPCLMMIKSLPSKRCPERTKIK